ncbi:hypothetical protein GALL_469800 [mine drainage metagenome]|uniref:Uncharacterized protein n=1 Tax=mine drainage metagenome TaxID=410659 RepID=A0A1J5PIH8_9ZZZZ
MQHVVGIAGRDAEIDCLQTGTYPRDGAMVIRTLDVDRAMKAALPLGDVIGHVGQEIGVAAVGLAHHPVFVVAEVGGAQPERAVLLIRVAGCDEALDGVRDLAFGIQAGFEVVAIEADAECLEIEILLAAQVGHGVAPHGVQIVRVAIGGDGSARIVRDRRLGQEITGDVADVVAVVGRLGPAVHARHEAPRAGLHRQRQVLNLHPGIVVVELALHRPPLSGQDGGDGVSQRSLPAMADMQRTGGIGGDELHQQRPPRTDSGMAVRRCGLFDFGDHALHHPRLQMQVDEPRSGDLGTGDSAGHIGLRHQQVDDLLRHVARAALQGPRKLHGQIARQFAVFFAARPAEFDGTSKLWQQALGGLLQRSRQPRGEFDHYR